MPYIIRAEIDATDDMPGMFARDWFECGVNDRSERYPSADAALIAAQSAYKGPDADGIEYRVWGPANRRLAVPAGNHARVPPNGE
jgi:hypothetical protein